MHTTVTRAGRRRTWFEVVGLLLVVTVVAAACGGSSDSGGGNDARSVESPDVTQPEEGDPTPGGSVIYGLEAESDGFDPTNNRWAISGNIIAWAIFDPLAAYDENGEWAPYLAQAFEPNEDFTEWIIRLRPNIKFHNGEPLNAAAVIGAMQGIKESILAGAAFKAIESIEPVPDDDLAVKVTMFQPWASFPATLTGQAGVIPAPEQLAAEGEAKSARPIGTGPFVFQEWVRDSRLVASKNPDYWMTDEQGNKLPYLEEVEFRPLPDVQARVGSLQTGDINLMHTTSNEQMIQLQAMADAGEIQLVEDRGENEETFVMLNSSAPPFDDVRARNAVAYATPYEEYRTTFQIPEELATDSAFSKDSPYYFDTDFPIFDQERARQLVAEYEADKGPLSFTLGTTTVNENIQAAQLLQQAYQQVGMDVNVQTTLQDQYIADAVFGRYQANLWRQFGANDPDADYVWWHRDNIDPEGISLNIARFDNEELSEALDQARTTRDVEARAAEYRKVQEIWARETPYIWLNTTRWAIGATNNVRHFWNNPLPDANNVANQPSIRFQSGGHRLTGTWVTG